MLKWIKLQIVNFLFKINTGFGVNAEIFDLDVTGNRIDPSNYIQYTEIEPGQVVEGEIVTRVNSETGVEA